VDGPCDSQCGSKALGCAAPGRGGATWCEGRPSTWTWGGGDEGSASGAQHQQVRPGARKDREPKLPVTMSTLSSKAHRGETA
jgi:hypothetical protein